MIIMQGADLSLWWWCETIITVLSVLCIWYFVVSGRDRSERKQRRQEIVEQMGPVQDNHAPLSKFLIWTYVLTALFIVSYVFWIGMEGMQF